MVGFAKFRLIRIRNDTLGNILCFAVHPEFRRKGIASTLTDAGVDYFRNYGIKSVYISAGKNNVSILDLLQKRGFKKIGFCSLLKLYDYKIIEFYVKMQNTPTEVVLVSEL